MEASNLTQNTAITIHEVKALTNEMLSTEIASDITLKLFLSQECTSLTHGQHALYVTKNCLFRHLEENRFVNEPHVQALMESYTKDGYLFTIIYVNEKLEIIDGQHRCEAAKRMGLPVYFMIMPGWGIKEVTILNVNSRNWTIVDFMETHAKAGNPNYVRFKEFYISQEFDVTSCQLIVFGKRSAGYAGTDEFRLGLMQVDEQQLTDAYLKVKKIEDFQLFHPNGWKSRNFVEAMLTLFKAKGYDHEHMVLKLQTYPDLLLAGAKSLRVEEYLGLFLDKYNFRRIKDKLEIARRR